MINRAVKATLPQDAQQALTVIRDHIADRRLATLVAHPLLEAIPHAPIDGFAAAGNGGVAMFFIDATGAQQTGQWHVQMCAGIALDCRAVNQALLWANARNRQVAVDRYFCALTQDQSMCGVAADASMSSILLDSFLHPANEPVIVALKSLAQNTLYTAAEDGPELAQALGGRRFTTSDQDLMTLFQIASG